MDMKTLSYDISYLLKQHETSYNLTAARINPDEISVVFAETEVNNFGRGIVYVIKESESVIRRAVRLVAVVLKDMDLTQFRIEDSFFRRMVSYVRRVESIYLINIRNYELFKTV